MNFPAANLNEYFNGFEEGAQKISVWGDFGVGKTTFALQTAINSAKSEKKVVFIYTKPNFPFEKVGNMIQEESIDILDNIIFIQPKDFDNLNTIVFNLEFLILKNLKKKDALLNLIVVDSITDLYRLELNREKKEKNFSLNYQLNQILANLLYLNHSYNIEVLIVNEISRMNQDGKTIEVQLGSKVINFWISNAIKISRTERINKRRFILSNHYEKKILEYISVLTESGFK